MLILTDCPDQISDFLAPGAEWRKALLESLDPSDRALWSELSSGPTIWIGEGPDPGPANFWSRAFVIGDAASSQFDILHKSLGTENRFSGPVACLALEGRNFHGQRGRPWQAASGNLHLCAGFQNLDLDARDGLALTMLPAVAVVEAVRIVSKNELKPGIKWVNDILLGERKVAGVITSTLSMKGKIAAATLGIGINISHAPQVPPTPFVPTVGCLGESFSLADVFRAVLTSLGKHYQDLVEGGPASLFRLYRDSSVVIGREVCIWDESDDADSTARVQGVVRKIAPDLSLEIEGFKKPITKGRLAFSNWEQLRISGPK